VKHYNYFRDYEPGTGRYVESDLIGLKGGLSTYGYVESSPLKLIDPLGLAGEGRKPSGEICPKVSEKAGFCWYRCSDGIYLAPKSDKSCPPVCRGAISPSQGQWVGNSDWLDGLIAP
jgi:uncharacterized protein RhaS with RHS repeats